MAGLYFFSEGSLHGVHLSTLFVYASADISYNVKQR